MHAVRRQGNAVYFTKWNERKMFSRSFRLILANPKNTPPRVGYKEGVRVTGEGCPPPPDWRGVGLSPRLPGVKADPGDTRKPPNRSSLFIRPFAPKFLGIFNKMLPKKCTNTKILSKKCLNWNFGPGGEVENVSFPCLPTALLWVDGFKKKPEGSLSYVWTSLGRV